MNGESIAVDIISWLVVIFCGVVVAYILYIFIRNVLLKRIYHHHELDESKVGLASSEVSFSNTRVSSHSSEERKGDNDDDDNDFELGGDLAPLRRPSPSVKHTTTLLRIEV
jgi:hypothetical protein